ncbi:helix-turn-helix domain-containing protein [Streptomyces araujoniae]|uniref:helix-turn-helix domain-containing protein n=1 Tax=Streptomyces sp. ZEA17I TaxID=2202516 RepID=UPI0011B3C143|nr:helix-turn-helix transcriptional regulator [Streptomyces sp. ZEA17I]
MAEQQKGRRSIEVGPTGRTVASNLVRLRKRAGYTTRQLATLLEQAGRPVPASGITRMEKAERVVTADDLVAFCIAFKVSPAAFLLPLKDSPRDAVEVTGAGVVPADAAWAWASNRRPLMTPSSETARTAESEYALASLPPTAREARLHPVGRAIEAARDDVTRLASYAGWSVEGDSDQEFADLLDQARTSLDRARAEVDRIAVERDELTRFRDGARSKTGEGGGDGQSVD